MELTPQQVRRFRIASYITIGIVLFLILVGGLVRATGSGMGCPDWPKCFGMWVPPTCECQVPEEYKNGDLPFNVYQTWTEYLNRLVGALTGLCVLAMGWFSLPYRKTNMRVTIFSLLSVFLVGFAGWLGKKVVDTNLHEGMITIHMVTALALVLTLLIAYTSAFPASTQEKSAPAIPKSLWIWGVAIVVITFIQIVLGTQVRENVDAVAKLLGEDKRAEWIGALGVVFRYHTSFYFLLLIGMMYWLQQLRQYFTGYPQVKNLSLALIGGIFAEIATGLSLDWLDIPRAAQPIHLLLGALIFAISIYLTIILKQLTDKPAHNV